MAGETDTGAESNGGSDKQVAAPVESGLAAVATISPQDNAALKPETLSTRTADATSNTMKVDAAPLFRTEARPGDRRAGDVLPTAPKDRIDSVEPTSGSMMERLLKGDKTKSEVNPEYADPKKQLEIFQRSGMTPQQAEKFQADILKRLGEKGDKLQGTAEEQLSRMTQALDTILDPTKAGAGADALKRLSEGDRQNLVKDFLMRMSDPEKYANQGAHNTCALTSMQKLALQGNDPAKLAEQLAGVVNNGFTFVTNPETGQPQRVDVHSASLRPDHESSIDPLQTRGNQTRSMAGHALDALFGQMAADNQGRVDGKKYVYLAANANDFTGARRSDTGEGFFEADGKGNPSKFIDSSPQMTLVAKAQLSRMLDLPKGVNFIHSSMVNEIPQGMRDQFTIFDNAADLKTKLANFSARTGLNSAEIRVNAPFLPGERMAGHGLHSVNISLDNGQVRVDNHWGDGKDLTLSDAQIDKASDKTKWNGEFPPSVYRPGQPQTPGNVIDGPTRLNTLPTVNESPDDYRKRMEQLKNDQDAKVKELENQKVKPDTSADKLKELTNELLNTEMIREAFAKAFSQFKAEMAAWSTSRSGSEPSLSDILNYELGRVRLK